MAVVQLLTSFMLGQSTFTLYHTEANGCIFFAAGVSDHMKYTVKMCLFANLQVLQCRLLFDYSSMRKILYIFESWP